MSIIIKHRLPQKKFPSLILSENRKLSNALVVFSLVELILSQEVVRWPVARSIKSTRKRQETYYTHTLSKRLQVSTGSRVTSGFAVALRCPLNWLFCYLACSITEVSHIEYSLIFHILLAQNQNCQSSPR